MKKKRDIKVNITFTDGWQDRFTKASYELYLRLEDEKRLEETNINKEISNKE
jgi:hypothetical protein